MTQQQVKQELAKRCGWSAGASSIVAEWEATGVPRRDIIIALAEIYGVSVDTLLAVKRLPNGKFETNDELIKQAQKENAARKEKIKKHNRDPHLK